MELPQFIEALPADIQFKLLSYSFVCDDCLSISLATAETIDAENRGEIVITLKQLRAFELCFDSNSRIISELSSGDKDPLLWNYQSKNSFFGKAALPDPPQFFTELSALLYEKFKTNITPASFLNWPSDYSSWRNLVLNRAYLLGTFPSALTEEISAILDAQVADYQVLPSRSEAEDFTGLVCTRIGKSWIISHSATLKTSLSAKN